MKKTLLITLLAASFATAAPTIAQEETAKQPDKEAALQSSLQHMLRRAELVRMLAAEHLIYIDSVRGESEVHLMDDATQVMAFSLVCQDEALDPKMINRIAAEATLQIAMKVNGSPIETRMTQIMGELAPSQRMTLVADLSTTALMFKIGRRRGLFDALLTDFGTARFCKGMRTNMIARYNGLAAYLTQPEGQ